MTTNNFNSPKGYSENKENSDSSNSDYIEQMKNMIMNSLLQKREENKETKRNLNNLIIGDGRKQLVDACRTGNNSLLLDLIEAGLNKKLIIENGAELILMVSEMDRRNTEDIYQINDIIITLIKNGADSSEEANSKIIYACVCEGYLEPIILMRQRGADINTKQIIGPKKGDPMFSIALQYFQQPLLKSSNIILFYLQNNVKYNEELVEEYKKIAKENAEFDTEGNQYLEAVKGFGCEFDNESLELLEKDSKGEIEKNPIKIKEMATQGLIKLINIYPPHTVWHANYQKESQISELRVIEKAKDFVLLGADPKEIGQNGYSLFDIAKKENHYLYNWLLKRTKNY